MPPIVSPATSSAHWPADGSTALSPPPALMKSISTPVISDGHHQGASNREDGKRGSIAEGVLESSCAQLASHMTGGEEEESILEAGQRCATEEEDEDEDEMLNEFLENDRSQARMSMVEFLNDTSNFGENIDRRKRDLKDEKKRRGSMFAKFGSYRQKKLVKDNKLQMNTHRFVSVSYSNATLCDMCGKPMANKLALQCENCLVNVHESTCKELVMVCSRYRQRKLMHHESVKERHGADASNNFTDPSTNLKGSHSFMERRTVSAARKPMLQGSLSANALLRPTSSSCTAGSMSKDRSSVGHFQWRRVATKLGLDKVLSENEDGEDTAKEDETTSLQSANHTLLTDISSINDTMSVSMESLDEGTSQFGDAGDTSVFENDPDLLLMKEEAEAWSVTVDKKTLRKLSAKDIKRQDHIWELIQTEKSHCRTLKIMRRILAEGMLREAGLTADMVERIFPKLDDLLDIHVAFLRRLTEAQKQHADRSVDHIGETLVQQFDGVMGERMKKAYGEFCSRHNESVQLYKDMLKADRKFQAFVKKCSSNHLCKRKGVTECILLVTQRITKYPLLIEPIIKTTKEISSDLEPLQRSLQLSRDVLNSIDRQVDAREKEQQLLVIYNKLDARSFAMFRSKKFKKSDLLSNNRKLIYQGYIKWMTARGKPFEVLAIVLSDVIFFLSETNQKYTFFSQDNKSSVVSLSKLIVREKSDTRDGKGVYLICQSKTEPEMYELVCKSTDSRRAWINTVRDAIVRCPEEDEGVPSEGEEERKLQEARAVKLRQLTEELQQQDNVIKRCCDEKMRLIMEMLESYGRDDSVTNLKSVYRDEEGQELMDPEEIIHVALYEASYLSTLLQTDVVQLGRSASSVSEHGHSNSYTASPLPKRAETFSGFEGKEKEKCLLKKRYPSSFREVDCRSDSVLSLGLDSEGSSRQTDSLAPKIPRARRGSIGVMNIQESSNRPNKERMGRRMSTSFLQSLLARQHTDKEDADSSVSSDRSSEKGSSGELSSLGSSVGSLSALSKEQLASLAQIVTYLQALACIATQQSTEVESFRAQLTEANTLVSQLVRQTDQLSHDRRSAFQHDKQLEELRNLQETIGQERSRLEALRLKYDESMAQQTKELQMARAEMEKEKAEMQAEKEELQRQRDALQRQIDLFELQRSSTPPSAPLSAPPTSSSLDSHTDFGGAAVRARILSSPTPTALITPLHQRSASDDSTRSRTMPVHLLSTTNERKLVPSTTVATPIVPVPQVLPYKLSSLSSSSLSKPPVPTVTTASSTVRLTASDASSRMSPRQRLLGATRPPGAPLNMLPMKLAQGRNADKTRLKTTASLNRGVALPPAATPNATSPAEPKITYF